MPATTTLLGLVTPTQGTLSGTWGDTVNYGISDYVDIAIAGTLSFTGDGPITLANTTGSASGNGFTTTTAQYMVIRVTGTLTTPKIITGPSYSKLYMVDNSATGSTVSFIRAGQTPAVSIAIGEKAFVYYNGTDYVKVASSVADGVTTIDFGSTGLTPNTATSGAVTVAGTLAPANGGTGVSNNAAMTVTGSGNFAYTRTLTGATNVTFPTTGTLSTLAGSETLTNKTLTTPIISTISNTGTLTLPTSTDTLVGRATTDTLTNKTLTLPVIDNIRMGFTQTATAAGTTTLTSASNHYQRFTGVTTQTVVLPVTSTLTVGMSYAIENASTGNLTVNSSGGNLVVTVIPGVTVQCMVIGTALTTAADWDPEYNEFASVTGTGAVVLATSPTLVTPALGTPSQGVMSSCTVDGTDAVGFRNIPQNSQSAAYTLVLADAGKHIFHPVGDNNARTFTIPANSSVAYPIGTAITFINMAVANVTIAITTDTLILSSAGTTGSRTLATNGSATCIKITSTSWLISGSGLT